VLHLSRLPTALPQGADDLLSDLYRRIPQTRITDIIQEVDRATGFDQFLTKTRVNPGVDVDTKTILCPGRADGTGLSDP